jgi:hypothetical protein
LSKPTEAKQNATLIFLVDPEAFERRDQQQGDERNQQSQRNVDHTSPG